jgi:hypothetical protein
MTWAVTTWVLDAAAMSIAAHAQAGGMARRRVRRRPNGAGPNLLDGRMEKIAGTGKRQFMGASHGCDER